MDPLENEGDRADDEESFATDFLTEELLPVLSNDVEGTLLTEEADDKDDLIEVLFKESCLVESEVEGVLGDVATGDAGTELLTAETLDREAILELTGGNELLRSSGRDLLTGSESEELDRLPSAVLRVASCFCFTTDVDCFSRNPPVLFLLVTETEPEVREALLTVDLVSVDFVPVKFADETFFISVFFFAIVVVEAFPLPVTEPFGLTPLVPFLMLSAEDGFTNSDSSGFSIKSLSENIIKFS